jgi:hypothetical protein
MKEVLGDLFGLLGQQHSEKRGGLGAVFLAVGRRRQAATQSELELQREKISLQLQ